MKRKIVVALGGNALQDKGTVSADAQKAVAARTASAIAGLLGKYKVAITHGNGPQVGSLLWHEEAAATKEMPAMGLETNVAMTQGQIGYWLQQALTNQLKGQAVLSVVTQTLVDAKDEAFAHPTKPIGAFYQKFTAKRLARRHGWKIKEASGRGWRRVVASPTPKAIVEADAIGQILDQQGVVISTGGGGVPVLDKAGKLVGVDAVIDKDLASGALAESLGAEALILLTNVSHAYLDYGQPTQRRLEHLTAKEAERLVADGQFGQGSMEPKIRAGLRFAQNGKGRRAIITSPDELASALAGKSGTIISSD